MSSTSMFESDVDAAQAHMLWKPRLDICIQLQNPEMKRTSG